MHEKPYRSVAKAISWRTVGTLDTIIVSNVPTVRQDIVLTTDLYGFSCINFLNSSHIEELFFYIVI